LTWLVIAVAGALGATARYLVDHLISTRLSGVFPWGTFAINVSGSFLAGVVTGLVLTGRTSTATATVVAGGFLGAYTTFSTAMYETSRLLEDGAHRVALVNLVAPLGASVAAASLGWGLVVVLVG
jgi:fluoride exporter